MKNEKAVTIFDVPGVDPDMQFFKDPITGMIFEPLSSVAAQSQEEVVRARLERLREESAQALRFIVDHGGLRRGERAEYLAC